MATPTGRFGPADRLRRAGEFTHVLRRGKRFPVGELVLMASRTSAAPDARRLGLTMSKRVGNAVARNHVKRRVREWFRARRGQVPAGTDLVVIGRPGAGDLGGAEISRKLDEALDTALRSRA